MMHMTFSHQNTGVNGGEDGVRKSTVSKPRQSNRIRIRCLMIRSTTMTITKEIIALTALGIPLGERDKKEKRK